MEFAYIFCDFLRFSEDKKIYIILCCCFLEKMIKSKENSIGAWAFLIGVILAVIIGVLASFISVSSLTKIYSSVLYGILVVIGLIVGFSITSTRKDSYNFMIAGTILVIVSKFGMESVIGTLIGLGIGTTVSSTFSALLALFVPATIVVAIKTVFGLAKI